MMDKLEAWLVLVTVFALLVGGYMLAWRSKRPLLRRLSSAVVAAVSGLAAFVCTVGYAVPSLGDLHDAGVSLREAILGNLLVWSICLAAWFIFIRFAVIALRKR